MSLTTEVHPSTLTVPAVTDAESTPLTTSEVNALLSMSAGSERKPVVPAANSAVQHFRTRGQVD